MPHSYQVHWKNRASGLVTMNATIEHWKAQDVSGCDSCKFTIIRLALEQRNSHFHYNYCIALNSIWTTAIDKLCFHAAMHQSTIPHRPPRNITALTLQIRQLCFPSIHWEAKGPNQRQLFFSLQHYLCQLTTCGLNYIVEDFGRIWLNTHPICSHFSPSWWNYHYNYSFEERVLYFGFVMRHTIKFRQNC